MNSLSPLDLSLLNAKGISLAQVNSQLDAFEKGFDFSSLVNSAKIGNGISKIEDKEQGRLLQKYEEFQSHFNFCKFVPASGAATRMFKHLFEWRDALKADSRSELIVFGKRIKEFSFANTLQEILQKKNKDLDTCIAQEDYLSILNALLDEDGLDYASLPKALIAFHTYKNGVRTALEEHLVEGALYANQEGKVRIHFTVSPEHLNKFKEKLSQTQAYYEKQYGVKYDISYSIQKASTDTIAVTMDNLPFRNEKDELVFRPGGHGALIENLNDLDADIVFIKNIDNVTPDRWKGDTVRYKKILCALLMELRECSFNYLKKLENFSQISELEIKEIVEFTQNKLHINIGEGWVKLDKMARLKYLQSYLNRPIRVCGMVKNEGEPGGGPFWVKNPKTGEISLQVVESSQIDMKNPAQKEIFASATHFNPVDLVCSITDYKGRKFDLKNYIDPQTVFISQKSVAGRDIKALELPGLWNGAMAHWTTIFVEVPGSVFTPVKTVDDLLREAHQ